MPSIADNVAKIYPAISSTKTAEYYSYISNWKDIYSGSPPWATVKCKKTKDSAERRRHLMGTAKFLCDKFANLIFAEQCDIQVTVPEYKDFLDKVLNRTGFWRHLPKLISSAFALGGFALKVYADNGKIMIDFVEADDFYPGKWVDDTITSAVFQTRITKGSDYYTLLEWQEVGRTVHKLYKSNTEDSLGTECPVSEVFDNLEESTIYTGINVPMFAYFCPSISNNILNAKIPLGISVFANAEDTLREIDIVFDSFGREFVLGSKRIIVPADAMQPVIDIETGKREFYYDTDDEVFVALNTEDVENLKITDNSANLRVQEHVTAINSLLNILCIQTGLSPGAISFDMVHGLKTATEVISENNETANTIKSDKNQLNETLETTFHAILNLAFALHVLEKKPYEITISWNDNVIIDDNTMIDNTIKIYSAGLLDLVSAVMKVNKCDEETAKAIVEKIKAEQSMGAADFFGEPQQKAETTEENPDAKE